MIALLLACAPVEGARTPPSLGPAATNRPNLLLVSMDTTRWDATSLDGSGDTTPNLAALATHGTTFDRAFSVGNESLYAHAALLTGRYPSEISVPDYASFALPESVPTVASVLRTYGYRTGAFTGGGHITADFGFDNGFDLFTASAGATRFGSFFDSVPEALSWIRGGDATKPWFAFVHGYDAHAPYVQRGPFLHPWPGETGSARVEQLVADPLATEQLRGNQWFVTRTPTDFTHAVGRTVLGTDFYRLPAEAGPDEAVIKLTEPELRHIRDHYKSGVYYADIWLGVLLAHVDLSTTLVVVVSDHGEDLLDHGWMNHRAGLWDSTLHVPLVVAGPGVPVGASRRELVELRRVLPTLLAAAEATVPVGAEARPLWEGSDRAVYAEGVMDEVSVRTADGRLTLQDARLAYGAPDLSTRSLTDGRAELADGPGGGARAVEPRDLPLATPLRDAILQWRSRTIPATTSGTPVPDALRDALQERGYWVPEASAGATGGG